MSPCGRAAEFRRGQWDRSRLRSLVARISGSRGHRTEQAELAVGDARPRDGKGLSPAREWRRRRSAGCGLRAVPSASSGAYGRHGQRRDRVRVRAGYDGFWLQRRLAQDGIACRVMDPASLKVDRRARRVKTDRVDAESLLRALQAWRRGDRQACRFIRVPSVEEGTHDGRIASTPG